MGKKEIGLLGVGLGVGAAVALLYAPRRGAVTRRFVRAKANSAAGYVKDKTSSLRGSAKDLVQQGRDKFEEVKDKVTTAYQVGRDEYSSQTSAPLP